MSNVLLIRVYQSVTEIQMTNGSVVIAWGWINHESCNTMGYNTTFLLCFITVILTLAEKIFLTPLLSPNMYTCTYMNRAPLLILVSLNSGCRGNFSVAVD